MKILLCPRVGGAFGYITDGWLNCMAERGHSVRRWDGSEETWHDFCPDLYIGSSGHQQKLPASRSCAVALHVNPYGPVTVKGIDESPDLRAWVASQKPDAVFGYGMEHDRFLWKYWNDKLGLKWVPMATAGDAVVYKKSPESSRRYDAVYLGGRWAYKGKTIDKYLIPALTSPGISYRLHGWGDWPDGMNSGALADHRASEFLGSGRVGPCMSEAHTQAYGFDIPERVFKLALCGTLPVHDPVPGLARVLPGLPMASSPEEYASLVLKWSRPDASQERMARAEQIRSVVLGGHTYHHRMASLFAAIGFSGEASGMIESPLLGGG